ncbi:MAG TPA: flagellin, partial [Lachnospiraceae bacterium]|nr:flagellin [Lachnospiraceae bacterium]
MKINSNIQAMITNNVLKRNEELLSKSSEKLSSGYRINSAQDNPSGMAITNKMNAQIKSLNKANQNASNAVNAIETAEGAVAEIQEMVQRMNELAVKASSGTNVTADREAIQEEIEQLTAEIERVAGETEYNTQNLLGGEQALKGYTDNAAVDVRDYNTLFKTSDEYSLTFSLDTEGNVTVAGSGFDSTATITTEDGTTTIKTANGGELTIDFDEDAIKQQISLSAAVPQTTTADLDISGVGGMKIQVGSSEGQEIQIVIPEISLENMGIEDIDVSTEEGAQAAIDQVTEALSFISSVRSKLGAYENRLETTISNLDVATENLTNSYSAIKDVDMADEMVEYTKLQVLTQAGT